MTIYVDPAARPGRAPIDEDYDERPLGKHRDPLWAKVCIILGALVMVVSGAAVVLPKVLAAWATDDINKEDLLPPELVAKNIDGPINILLLGMDERTGNGDLIRTDTIMIAHIPATHDSVYLVSLPRDTKVEIPSFEQTGYLGGTDKINAAFAIANRTRSPNGGWVGDPTTAGRQRGVGLVAQTVSNLVPGGLQFNAVAIINFNGFRNILKAIGGVDMCVDVETRSVHYDRNNKYHTNEVPYANRKIYKKGCYHMAPSEALDFARQRHFDDGDYTRQRHQQQLLMAIFKKMMSKGVLADPGKLLELQKTAGDLLTMDLGATAIADWVFTLKGLRGDSVVPIKTNGGNVTPDSDPTTSYQVLSQDSLDLLKSVKEDKVYGFLVRHPTWIANSK
jgi:LCP family protein required for cell wall assembly